MSPVDAVSVSPTRAVPAISGAPVAGAFAASSGGGPATVADGLLVSGRGFSPRVQIAPDGPQSSVAGSSIATAASESGCTVIRHPWLLPCASRPTPSTEPPSISNASSRSVT